jgi:hypothetical protein
MVSRDTLMRMNTTIRFYFGHFHIQHLTGAGVANA